VYKKFSKNALNYGGGPSFGTAQFSADLEKTEVVSSRDQLGLPGRLAPRGCRACRRPGRRGSPGMLAPVHGGNWWVQGQLTPVGPRSRPGSPDGLARVMCPCSQGAGGPVEATGPRANPPSPQPSKICLRSDRGRDIYPSPTPCCPTYTLTYIFAGGCDQCCDSQARRSTIYISGNG
jgi:hypothetical protein